MIVIGVVALVGALLVMCSALLVFLRRVQWARNAERAGIIPAGSGGGYVIVLVVVQVLLAGVLLIFGVSLLRGAPLPENFRALIVLSEYAPVWILWTVGLVGGLIAAGGAFWLRRRRHALASEAPDGPAPRNATMALLPEVVVAIGAVTIGMVIFAATLGGHLSVV
ncbi:hypothetical protein LJR045_001091 [Microbacterium sp. LjRoot45]|uniref:hypothetical protein n=1 Tax=Microbacterium sp. LjRoot45 TaxID=3342329 RepID=UPI003ECE1A53